MRSDHSPASKNKSPDFSSLEELQSHYRKLLLISISNLNKALEAAFADKKKDHPSQLVYATLWNELNDIFYSNKPVEKLGVLEKRFELIRERLIALTDLYFADNKNTIAKNIPLMKKMGIKDINKFEFKAEAFCKGLSNRKQELLKVLIDTMELFARLNYLLQINPADDTCKLMFKQGDSIIAEYTRWLEHIDYALQTDFSSTSQFFFGMDVDIKPTPMDEFFADASDEKKLSDQIQTLLQERKKDIAKIVNCHLSKLEREVYSVQDAYDLTSRIESYKKTYEKAVVDISENKMNESDYSEVLNTLYSKRKSLTAEINAVGELGKKRDVISKSLDKERKECIERKYQFTHFNEEQLQRLPVIREFGVRHQKLDSLRNALIKAKELFDKLKNRHEKQIISVKQEIEKSVNIYAQECCDCSEKIIDQVGLLAEQSKEQTANNILWEKNVPVALEPFDHLTEELKVCFANKERLTAFADVQTHEQMEYIKNNMHCNDNAHGNAISKREKAISDSQLTLEQKESSTRSLLAKIQSQEFNSALDLVKKEYISRLENLQDSLKKLNFSQVKSDVRNIELPDPMALQELPGNRNIIIHKQVPTARNFFRNHWKAISATTTSFALAGMGIGLGVGLGGAVATFGSGAVVVPLLAVAGFIGGAVVGFAASCLGSYWVDMKNKKRIADATVKTIKRVSMEMTYSMVNQALENSHQVTARAAVGKLPPVIHLKHEMTIGEKVRSIFDLHLFHHSNEPLIKSQAIDEHSSADLTLKKV